MTCVAGVGGGDGEAALTHDGEVDDVVAYVAELVDACSGFGEDVVDGVHLVGLALVDELEFEVVGADGYGLGVALGDDADAEAAEAAEGDAETVVGGEAFGLDAVAVGALGMTKIWPSVRTPSTSKMRIFMFLARASAVIR